MEYIGYGWYDMAGVRAKNKKYTIKALQEQIKLVEETIEKKLKTGDVRGVNSMMKKLTKLKRELKRYKYSK